MDNKETLRLQRSIDLLNRKMDGLLERISANFKGNDRLISVREASKLLNRSEYCLRQDINQGLIPAKKVGRGWLLSFNEVQRRISNPI